MGRVAFTEEQKRDRANLEFRLALLRAMNARRGAADLDKKEFAKKLGIGESTWRKWNRTQLENAPLGMVLDAVQRAGISIKSLDVGF